jgi:rSAM/selenodomain-associated transferase 1
MRKQPALVIFARAPVAGRTKTRLMRTIGPRRAAELYRCFLLDTFAGARTQPTDVIVAAAEADHLQPIGELVSEVGLDADLAVQSGGDLGHRIAHAVSETLDRGYPRVVVIGSDAPSLPPRCVGEALDLSADHDLVLGPCFDGGYYLVGLRRAVPEIFHGITWSSDTVLVDSVRRATEGGRSVALLDPWYDVDTAADLRLLQTHLTALSLCGESIPCPRTWQHLSDMELVEKEL